MIKHIALANLFLGSLFLAGCVSTPHSSLESLDTKPDYAVQTSPEAVLNKDFVGEALTLNKQVEVQFTNRDAVVILDQEKNLRAPYKVFNFTMHNEGPVELKFSSPAQIAGLGDESVILPTVKLVNADDRTKEIPVLSNGWEYTSKDEKRYRLYSGYRVANLAKGNYILFVAPDTRETQKPLNQGKLRDLKANAFGRLEVEVGTKL